MRIGQVIFVEKIHLFLDKEPTVHECTITRFNTNSVYAKHNKYGYEIRLDRRKMSSKSGDLYFYVAYETKEEYREVVKLKEEVRQLKTEIYKMLPVLSVQVLRDIQAIINRMEIQK